ncbi:MAG TPA: hypothetical protein VGO79_13950 [Thermoanaerobaculia bacterium]|jgi:hypothetical protein
MGIKLKSLASGIVLGFVLLFFGPATATAKADHFSTRVVAPARGAHAFVHRGFAPVRHRAFVRPYRFARPYGANRVVRVFVPLPFPHWVYRSVSYGPYSPYAGAYRPY